MVRRQLGTRSVGHAGTLDPFATGLLVVLVGRATRLARFIESERKRYHAVVRLGVATDSDDATGTVTAAVEPTEWPSREVLDAATATLVGPQAQRPPAYSAKHVDGSRAYALARAGKAVTLAPVEVMVHAIAIESWSPPLLTLHAEVGRGTYLRAIARDLGAAVGLPAHCAELRRTAIGPFRVEEAIAPSEVTAEALRSPAEMLGGLPQLVVDQAARRHLGFGRPVPRSGTEAGPVALIGEDGVLVAVAVAHEEWWQPEVVLEPAS